MGKRTGIYVWLLGFPFRPLKVSQGLDVRAVSLLEPPCGSFRGSVHQIDQGRVFLALVLVFLWSGVLFGMVWVFGGLPSVLGVCSWIDQLLNCRNPVTPVGKRVGSAWAIAPRFLGRVLNGKYIRLRDFGAKLADPFTSL